MLELRGYQVEAVAAIHEDLRVHKRALLSLAVGLGKTACAMQVMRDCGSALFVTNKIDLAVQSLDRWKQYFGVSEDVGLCVGSKGRREIKQFTFATVQTASKLDMNAFKLVVLDETHVELDAETSWYRKLLDSCRDSYVLGLTATPFRNGKGYIYGKGKFYPRVSYEKGIKWGVDQGFLVEPKLKAGGQSEFDTTKVGIKMGDFDIGSLGELAANPNKVHEQVTDALGRIKDRKCVVWSCVNIEHANMVADKINELGSDWALSYHSQTEGRYEHLEYFKQGKYKHMTFVNTVSEGFDCLDSNTEILTDNGWKGMGQVREGDLIYSANKENKLEIVPVEKYFERHVREDEKIIEIKSQHCDIRTTEAHRFYWAPITAKRMGKERVASVVGEYKLSTFNQVTNRFRMLYNGVSIEQTGIFLSNDALYILGMLWTDGWRQKDGPQASLYQSKPHIVDKIRLKLKSIGVDFTEQIRLKDKLKGYGSNYDGYIFHIPAGTHNGTLKRNGYTQVYGDLFTKKPHRYLLNMTREQFLSFWDGMCDGNGIHNANKPNASLRVCLSDKEQVDFIMMLAVRLGFAVMYGSYKTKAGVEIYNVCVKEKTTIDFCLNDKRGAKVKIEAPLQKEKVWCVSNKNKTLITRRNGKVIVLGNCPMIDTIVLMRPTRSPVLAIQQIGRTLRPFGEKKDSIILDYGQVIRNIGPIDKPIVRETTKRDKKQDALVAAQLKTCPGCLSYVPSATRECPDCGHDFFVDVLKNVKHRPDFESKLFSSESGSRIKWETVGDVSAEYRPSTKGNMMIAVHFRKTIFDGPWGGYRDHIVFQRWNKDKAILKVAAYAGPMFSDWSFDKPELCVRAINNSDVSAILVDETGKWPKVLRVRKADGREIFVG